MPRPTSILVFGILNLVFGGLGLCAPISLMQLFVDVPGQPPNPVIERMKDDALLYNWIVVSTIIGLVLAVALIVAGIGLIREKAWGRSLSILYAWIAIVVGVVGTVVMAILLLVPMVQELSGQSTPEEIGGVIGGVAGGIGGCFGLIYPLLLLIFMNRRVVREFFQAEPG